MYWDDLVRRWHRESGGLSPRLLRGTAGHVAVLPEPRPRRSPLPGLLAVLALVLALLLLASGGMTGPSQTDSSPAPASLEPEP